MEFVIFALQFERYKRFMRQLRTISILFAMAISMVMNADDKYVGGDISMFTAYQEADAIYKDTEGAQITDLMAYFSENSHNAMRVRLFHTPSNASSSEQAEGVIQDLPYVANLAKQIKDAGFALVLDIHYSDTWADPAKQWTPAAWVGLDDDVLGDSVYEYTKMVLQYLVDYGATPDFIQTGNEISYGFLWGAEDASSLKKYYASTGQNQSRFTTLLKRASAACREICPDAKIILHTERVANTSYLKQFYEDMEEDEVDYDIIGTSYYSYYHGYLSQLEAALTVLETFDKEIMVVEVGYYHAYQSSVDYDYSDVYPISDAGQKSFTKALIEILNSHESVTGLFWWDMEANEYGVSDSVTSSWYNASLFDNETGMAMGAITVLKNFLGIYDDEDDEDDDDTVYFYYVNDYGWDNVYVAIYDSSWNFLYGTEWSTDGVELTDVIGTYNDYDVYKYVYEGDDDTQPTYIIFFNGSYGTGNQSENCAYVQGRVYQSDGTTISISEVTLGITEIMADTDSSSSIYSISGQYLGTDASHLPKGIYIVKGKKLIVK